MVRDEELDRRWHIHAEGKTYGPFSITSLRDMAQKGQLIPSDEICAEGTTSWVQANKDPTLRTIFPNRSPEPPVRSRASTKRRFGIVAGTVVLVSLIWLAWPYYAVYDLFQAVKNGDVATLETRVAWDSVRQGLRGQLNAMLLAKLQAPTTDTGSQLGNGFAAMLGPAIVNQTIDSYVTPQALAAIKQTTATQPAAVGSERSATAQNSQAAIQQAKRASIEDIKYAFFSPHPFRFRVEVLPPNDKSSLVTLMFDWSGGWKLTQVLLPENLLSDESPTRAKSLPGKGSTLAKAEDERMFHVELVSKGFKSSNPRASDFDDFVLFELMITNLTSKDVRAFDGALTFTDLLDNQILSAKLAINESIESAAKMRWSGTIKYNQFIDAHQRLKNAQQDGLKVSFVTRKILFADGSTKEN